MSSNEFTKHRSGTPEYRDARVAAHLSEGGDRWMINNSDVASYDMSFQEVLGGASIVTLVSKKQGWRHNPVRIVDFMATPSVLSELSYRVGGNIRGTSVSLSDDRPNQVKDFDTARGISHVVGDLARLETYRKLRKSMLGEKADIILERGWGGLALLPQTAEYYETAFNAMLAIMKPGAVLLAQLPSQEHFDNAGLAHPLTCVDDLRSQGIDIDVGPDRRTFYGTHDVIKLVKTDAMPGRVRLRRSTRSVRHHDTVLR